MAVLTLLMVLITTLLNTTSIVTGAGNKHMDADGAARALLDRVAVDIGAMVRRSDVDYYLKGRPAANGQPGNDQIAFYSEVAGYYPTTTTTLQSPISLVAYRLNDTSLRIERLGKGLLWNGASTSSTPVVFLPVPMASPLPSPLPSPMPAPIPAPAWPQAGNMDADQDYEAIGPQIFRMEYYYVLRGQDVSTNPSILSDTPWDPRPPLQSNSVSGLRDVAAIGMVIAVIDPKTRALVTDAQLKTLSQGMKDFAPTTMSKPGDLEAQWQAALDASSLPKFTSSAIRIYGRTFLLGAYP